MLRALAISAALIAGSLFASSAAPFGGGEACRQAAAQSKPRSFDYDQELFFAVLEGLYADGVSSEAVDAILARDAASGRPANFVWGCPICMPAYEALRLYRARPMFESYKGLRDTFGPGLDPALLARMTSGPLASRQTAIKELVETWNARRIAALRLSDAEHAAWQSEMEMRRKKGMSILASLREEPDAGSLASMKACAFCDGANGACAKR